MNRWLSYQQSRISYALILCRLPLCGCTLLDKISYVLIRRNQILCAQIHHVATAVAFKAQPVFHPSARVQLPHRIFCIEVSGSTVIVARLDHHMQVRIFGHGQAQVFSGVVVGIVPRAHRAKHVVLQIGFVFQHITQIIIDGWRE